ncbi:MAG: SLBB domain-containing protein [Ignavibacteriaceae bacterium]
MNIFQSSSKLFFSSKDIRKIILFPVILFLFLFAPVIKSQVQNYQDAAALPDYQERTVSKDSLLLNQNMNSEDNESIDPDEYVVGPGDKFFISINGLEEIPINTRINHDGILFVPKVGGIDLKNKTLTEAKAEILDAIDKYYKNVDIFISLINIRKIKVSLVGNVVKPASFILKGNSRLMDLISSSNGLKKTADYRNIKIISKDSSVKKYDLLSFIRLGDKKDNPLLMDGDVVLTDKVDKTISIAGEVKFPGIYEYVQGETIFDFIKLSGGLLNDALKDTIEVVSFQPDGKSEISRYFSYETLTENQILLKNKDKILVRAIPDYFNEKFVKIKGYVKYPGYYKIVENQTTLVDVINEAGGFRKEASLADASLSRTEGTKVDDPEYDRLKTLPRADMTDDEYNYLKAKSRQRIGRVVVDFVELFKKHDLNENIYLKTGDSISVPEARNYVILLGQVVNPGNVIYDPKLKVDDYIQLAGGFGWRAEKGDVRVIKANTGEWVDADDVDSLETGDTIWIPETPPGPKFWDVFTSSLAILGQVASIIAATIAVIIATRK